MSPPSEQAYMHAPPLQFNPDPGQQSLVCEHDAAAGRQGTVHSPPLHSKPLQHWPVPLHAAVARMHSPPLPMTFTLTGMFIVSEVSLSLPVAVSVICEL